MGIRFLDFLDLGCWILKAVIVAWAPIENYRHDGGQDTQQSLPSDIPQFGCNITFGIPDFLIVGVL